MNNNIKKELKMKNVYNFILISAILGCSLSPASAADVCSNIAVSKTATASASTSLEIPGRALDDNFTTQWCAPGNVGWIKVDLLKKNTINKMKLYVNQAVSGNTVHEIKVSSDMVNWTLVKTLSGYTTNNQALDVSFNPALSDIQGVMINTTQSNSWVAWYEIQVFSGPTKPTISKEGAVLTSSSTTNNQWYLNGNPISGANSQSYSATSAGSYQVGVSAGVDCESLSEIEAVSITTGINDNAEKNVKIYPNPAKDNVVIEGVTSGKIELINLQGQILKQVTISETNSGLDISTITNGVYSIKITTKDGIIVKKLVKQ